jgi:nucleotide-binding universal stress UspA family protein
MKVEKILAPTDLSDLSQAGIRYAMELAQSEGAEVLVYHVVEASGEWFVRRGEFQTIDSLVQRHKILLAQFVKVTCGDSVSRVSIRQEVDFGVSYEKIVGKAEEEKADIIVMSTHGWTGLLHVLIGSVTEKVVNRASCPVLSIQPAAVSGTSHVRAAQAGRANPIG